MIELVPFYELDLGLKKMILSWRNSDKVRLYMYNKNRIDLNSHLSFIDSLKDTNNRRYFLVKKDSKYIGVIDINSISKESAYGGLYQNPDLKGFGEVLLFTLIDYCFNNLRVKRIILEVFEENKKAIKLYKKMGFIEFEESFYSSKKLKRLELVNENR